MLWRRKRGWGEIRGEGGGWQISQIINTSLMNYMFFGSAEQRMVDTGGDYRKLLLVQTFHCGLNSGIADYFWVSHAYQTNSCLTEISPPN